MSGSSSHLSETNPFAERRNLMPISGGVQGPPGPEQGDANQNQARRQQGIKREDTLELINQVRDKSAEVMQVICPTTPP